ncbi:hypothetical protein [Halorussus salinus]|uniref:hypothetical protein n=1 Tax=Halorussus salinus TaxID=1364935 RepID=UPI0010925F1F|nr:hypothetical protein [Halorussus salinus]
MRDDPLDELPMQIGLSLMTGLTAGIGATYYLNRGPASLIVFIIGIYPIILGMVLAARRFINWLEDDDDDPPPPPYAS